MDCVRCGKITRGNRYRCDTCAHREWRNGNRNRYRQWHRNHNVSIRLKLLNIIGMKCVKCGFSDIRAIQVDVKSGGHVKALREVFGQNTISFYRFYIRFPELALKDLQPLCANCNWIKRSENNEVKTKEENILAINV